MPVLKEWHCLFHGYFESTHSVCPGLPCDSSCVERVFLTPPHVRSDTMKRFDKGIKLSSDMMGISNFRTVRANEPAHGGELGKQLLWGKDIEKAFNGKGIKDLATMAAQPLDFTTRNGHHIHDDRNNGMAEAATAAGITSRRVPRPGQLSTHKSDESSVAVMSQVLK